MIELKPIRLTEGLHLRRGGYLLSKLLDELTGRLSIPTVLLYPGVDEGGLRFMGLRDRETTANYRVKVY